MATLKLKIGDDNTVRITVTEDDGTTAVNITGGTLKIKIAVNINIPDVSATYLETITSFTDPTNGIHDLVIPDSESSTWTARQEKIQARYIDSTGVVQSEDVDSVILEKNLIDSE